MERVIFLEILDRRGQVRQRERIDALPVRLGRGYDNDIIVDDPYVSPTHALLDEVPGTGLVLRDLGSENGVRVGDRTLREEHTALEVPADFRLGRTRCRLRDPRHELPATLRDATHPSFRLDRLVQRPGLGLALLVAVVASTAIGALDGARREPDWGRVAEEMLSTGLALGVWVGLWALITRVLTPRTRALGHFIVVASYTLFEAVLGWAGNWLRFVVTAITPLEAFELVVTLGAAIAAFYAHVSLTGGLQQTMRLGLAALLGLAFVSTNQLDTVFRRPDWVQVLPYWSRLEPLSPRLLRTVDDAQFFEATGRLRDPLDRDAARAVASRSDTRETRDRKESDELRNP